MNKMNFTMFAIGVGIGSIATWLYTKKKYEEIAQEEIDSVKEVYAKKNTSTEITSADETKVASEDMDEYNEKLHECNYANPNEVQSNKESSEKKDGPYLISIGEFGEIENHDEISLYYYSDGVLTDADDNIIDDTDAVIGSESLKYLEDREEDCVYVRNEKLECDYEVVRDLRSYFEAVKGKPHQRED